MKKIMEIKVLLTEQSTVKGLHETVSLVLFQGGVTGELFNGVILPGGVDTQITRNGKTVLSARYIAEGKDAGGVPTKLFIENNSAGGDDETTPKIVADNPSLAWLENARLCGKIKPSGEGVNIEIFCHEGDVPS